jgi:hypothetical protein
MSVEEDGCLTQIYHHLAFYEKTALPSPYTGIREIFSIHQMGIA